MARPERNNVDYFPFYCKEGKSMHYIENKYRNDGFSTWIKILRALAKTDYHYLNLSDRIEIMFLTSKCMVSEEMLFNIINDLCDLGEIDKELWVTHKIIFSQKFIDSVQDAYARRYNKCITRVELLTKITGVKQVDDVINKEKDCNNTQSIVNKTKENETIQNNIKTVKLIDVFFDDLPNSSEFETIARNNKVSKEDLLKFIDPFRLKAEFDYPNFSKFASHFKNFYLKEKNNVGSKKTNYAGNKARVTELSDAAGKILSDPSNFKLKGGDNE